MDTKTIVACSCASIALLIGGYLTLKSMSSNDPTTKNIESVMHGLSTDELITRRHFMAQQVEQAQASAGAEKHPLLISAEESLEELDSILVDRGVDLESLPKLSDYDIDHSMRASKP